VRTHVWTGVTCAILGAAIIWPGQAAGTITLQASADIVQPTANAAYQANSGGYADATFEAANTWVMATGGETCGYVDISWSMMIGWDEGNQGVAVDEGSRVVQFDERGEWRQEATLVGDGTVTVGVRHARALAEVWVTGTQNRAYADHVHQFSVVGQQGGGGGGDT